MKDEEPTELETALFDLINTLANHLKIYEVMDWLVKILNKISKRKE